MSESGIIPINSGPLLLRAYLGSSPNNTYLLGPFDVPFSTNRVLITSTNGLLAPSDSIYVSSITVSSLSASTTYSSTITTCLVNYSTLIGSTLNAATGLVGSTLVVGSTILAPTIQFSSLIGSTLTTATGTVQSTLLVNSTLVASTVQFSSLIGSTLMTTTATVQSSLLVGSTLTVAFLQLSTLSGSTLTVANAGVQSTLTASTIVARTIQFSTLSGATMTVTNATVQSTLTASTAQFSTLAASTMYVSSFLATSVAVSSMVGSTISTTTLTTASFSTLSMAVSTATVSTIYNFQGIPYTTGGNSQVYGLVCSNLPLTLGNFSAYVDRATASIKLTTTITNCNVIYQSEYNAWNGSAYVWGSDAPRSTLTLLTSLKFPTSYSLGAVGAWCSAYFTDMTTYSGTWNVTATCLRTGANGADLYSLELVNVLASVPVTSVPSVPQNVAATIVANGISFSFSPPATTGGYISGYEAFAGGLSQVGTASPIVVTGLSIGTSYPLSIVARNAAGQSGSATVIPSAITYQTLPSAPTNIVGTLTPAGAVTGISVAFTPLAPAANIISYTASAVDFNRIQSTITASNATTPILLTTAMGLIPGTTYQLQVYDTNSVGSSALGIGAATLLYQIPPAAPTITGLSLLSNGISVAFAAPANTGGGISSYTLSVYNPTSTLNATYPNATSPYSVTTGLTVGNIYSFQVVGINTGGTGTTSASSSLLYQTVPGAPTLTTVSLVTVSTVTSVSVAFTAPANTGGGITSYTVTAQNGAFSTSATASSSPITISGAGLAINTSYNYTVTATNTAGTSVTSNTVAGIYKTLPGLLVPLTNLVGALQPTVNATGVNLSFTVPANIDGGSIESYAVSAIPVGGGTTVTGSSSSGSPIYLSGLTSGTTYQFTVAPVNAAGQGTVVYSASNLLYQTTPGAPTLSSVTLTPAGNPTGVTLVFTPPSGGVSSYTASVSLLSGGAAITSVTGSASPLVISASTYLTAGTLYYYSVAATNTSGTSVASNIISAIYKLPPGAPTISASPAPAVLYPSGAATGIQLSFTAPANTGGGVDIYYGSAIPVGGGTTVSASNSVSPITFTTGLVAGTTYSFSITASNAGGVSAATTNPIGTNLLFQTPPSASPIITGVALTPSVSPSGIAVSFTAPAVSGGGITNYTATAYLLGVATAFSTTSTDNTATSLTVTGLTAGTSYSFKVTANNTGGKGTPSSPSTTIAYYTKPVAPTITAVALYPTAAPTGVNVTFTPGNNGGDGNTVLTYYVAAYNGSGGLVSTAGPSASTTMYINGLTAGITYYFGATEANPAITSDPSATVGLLYQTNPSAPTSVVATIPFASSDGQATVSWTGSSSTGTTSGSTITYSIRYSSDGGTTYSSKFSTGFPYNGEYPSTSNSGVVVTGLTNGTSYLFTVTATNIASLSAVSAASSAVTPYGTPTAPQNVTASQPSAGNVTVSWAAPASINGGTISYRVTSNPGTYDSGSTTSLSYTSSSGLTYGTSTTFTVTATNMGGSGHTSTATTTLTPYTSPGSFTATATVSVANTQPVITWTTPTIGGGTLSYRVTGGSYDSGYGASSGLSTTGLATNGTSYTFTVYAKNTGGYISTATSNSITPFTTPAAPDSISATPGNTQATINWTSTGSNGGKAITGYKITGSYTSGYVAGNPGNRTFTGLSNGTTYTYNVSLSNDGGSTYSSETTISARPFTTPSPPTNVTVSTAGVITWTAPTIDGLGGSSQFTSVVTSNTGGYTSAPLAYNVTTATQSGLTLGISYVFTVTVTNSSGATSSASSISTLLGGGPSAPTSLSTSQDGSTLGKVTVTWSAPAANNGSAIINYYVKVSGSYIPTGSTASPQSYTFTGLAGNTDYTFYVYAQNGLGAGTVGSQSFTTNGVPNAPAAATASHKFGPNEVVDSDDNYLGDNYQIEGNFTTVSYTIGAQNGGAMTSYRLRFSDGGDYILTWAQVGQAVYNNNPPLSI